MEYKTIRIEGATFENPVWIDLVSGVVYEIPAKCMKVKNGVVTIKDVPVYDAPVVITDKSVLE